MTQSITDRLGPFMTLVLKRTSKHRPGGPWSDEDYDVFDGERCIGRILRTHAAPEDRQILISADTAITG